jgi:hypothetical protein
MTRKFILLTALAASATTVVAASPASAQSWGGYVDSGRPAPRYYQQRYDSYYNDNDRRAAWAARRHWEARQRWEREEARRRYRDQERREHRWQDREEDEEDN